MIIFGKHYYLTVLSLSVMMLLFSCEDQLSYYGKPTPSLKAYYLNINNSSITFNASSDLEETMNVSATNTPWRFEGYDSSWLTFSPNSGNSDATVTVTAAINALPTIRTSTALFKSTDPDYNYSEQIFITQKAAAAFIEAEASAVEFTAGAGEKSVGVSSNLEWKTSSSVDWLSPKASTDGKSVLIAASENLTGSTRTGKIYITSADDNYSVSTTISVTQSASESPETTKNTLEVDYTGGTYTMSINSEVAWTATTSESWIQIDPEEGKAGTTTFAVQVARNASANNRTGYVSIKVGGTEKTRIAVVQKGLYVEVAPTSLTFTAASQQQKLQVKSNIAWTVLEMPDWLTVSANGATGNAELTLTASANLSDTPRTGVLKIGQKNSGIAAQVNITQNAMYFNITPTSFAEISSRGGTHTIHIATDDRWTAMSSSNWMQMSQTSGQGDIDVTMTIPDNPSLKSRRDTTTFTPAYAQPVRIITIQAGRYLTVDVTALTFFYKGGTSDVVTINTDATYTISSSESWLTIQQNGNTFTAIATEHNGDSDREGKITLTMTGLINGESFFIDIPVRQRVFTPGINAEGFGEDKTWEIVVGSGMTITVKGFSSDKNWD